MTQILLTTLMWAVTPIPWIVTAIHILITNNKLRKGHAKATVWIVSIAMWIILAWWLRFNYQFLLEQHFSNSLSIYFGIILLFIAVLIEVATTKALGWKRILGNSEYELPPAYAGGVLEGKLRLSGIFPSLSFNIFANDLFIDTNCRYEVAT